MLQLPPTVQRQVLSGVGLIGDSKLWIGVNVSGVLVLALCGDLSRLYLAFRPMVAGIEMHGWMYIDQA